MANETADASGTTVSREKLADLLNEDLEREYQAIIAYVVYSQVLKGAEYMNIAAQLEVHAQQELQHALTISRRLAFFGKFRTGRQKPAKVSDKPGESLQFDLAKKTETTANNQRATGSVKASGSSRWP